MVKSIVEGVQLIRTNPAVSKLAIARYMKIKDEKVLEDSYQQLKATAEIKPYPSAEGFKTILDELAKKLPAARSGQSRRFHGRALYSGTGQVRLH